MFAAQRKPCVHTNDGGLAWPPRRGSTSLQVVGRARLVFPFPLLLCVWLLSRVRLLAKGLSGTTLDFGQPENPTQNCFVWSSASDLFFLSRARISLGMFAWVGESSSDESMCVESVWSSCTSGCHAWSLCARRHGHVSAPQTDGVSLYLFRMRSVEGLTCGTAAVPCAVLFWWRFVGCSFFFFFFFFALLLPFPPSMPLQSTMSNMRLRYMLRG